MIVVLLAESIAHATDCIWGIFDVFIQCTISTNKMADDKCCKLHTKKVSDFKQITDGFYATKESIQKKILLLSCPLSPIRCCYTWLVHSSSAFSQPNSWFHSMWTSYIDFLTRILTRTVHSFQHTRLENPLVLILRTKMPNWQFYRHGTCVCFYVTVNIFSLQKNLLNLWSHCPTLEIQDMITSVSRLCESFLGSQSCNYCCTRLGAGAQKQVTVGSEPSFSWPSTSGCMAFTEGRERTAGPGSP